MFGKFTGAGGDDAWPVAKIVAALEGQYSSAELLGEDGPLKVYGVQDNGVSFVVALMQSAPDSGKVVELGFLARFVGFDVSMPAIERINRNLHISVATMEGADLFLMAGLQVTGAYSDNQFQLLLEAWRRDVAVTMHGLSGEQASMAAAFPAARLERAINFATNSAPEPDSGRSPVEMLSQFMGTKAAMTECPECDGRGKRGLIARTCTDCGGEGFVKAPAR